MHGNAGMGFFTHDAPADALIIPLMLRGLNKVFGHEVCYSSRGFALSVIGRMTLIKTILAVTAVVLCLSSVLAGQQKSHAGASAKVARGKYLVESIGACADCHTPRNEKGEFVKQQWLQEQLSISSRPCPCRCGPTNRRISLDCRGGRRMQRFDFS